ncbi:TonB-dependent receptor [Pseudohaliea rubra]|uniref:TonB-dependent receptor n=1 Tax=Pseudohaliea rubra DSM 19751 TaxID=1265313 RepID=A0A095VUH5_9GAMM|nr:TonB-dependent receptor [Pseudohaliea rubra]KGE04713.1 TonB-dependent receptor [Pseudohaliea rubra DSM 19751]
MQQHTPLYLALAALATGAPIAVAQDEPRPAAGQIEEVSVYAQRREQTVADVPISITAYSGDLLERANIIELDALSDITPGLVIQEQSPNNPGFVIRGITSDSGSSQAAPRVSVYYNGVDVSRSRGSYFELFDIERVEVVKGPQATLFGTAASVGAVSVYTARPQEELAGSLTVNAGNYSSRLARGFVTGGSDLVQARLAFQHRERDGFIDNIAGSPASQNPDGFRQSDLQGIERTALRSSLRLTPTDDLTIDFVYTWEENDDTGTSFKNGLYAPTGGDSSPFSFVEMAGSPFSEAALGKADLGIEREVEDYNLRMEWQPTERLTVTSLSAWREFESLEVFDADGTQAWFLEFGEDAEGEQFNQELRAVYSGDRFTTIVGANYFDEEGSQRVPFSTEESIFLNCVGALPVDAACIEPDGRVNLLTPVLTSGLLDVLPYSSEFANYGKNEILSAFADVTWAASDALELTAGLRYIDESRESGFSAIAPNSALLGFLGLNQPLLPVVDTGGAIVRADGSFDDWLPRFNALWRVSDSTNVYATVSKGRRSDVIDVTATRDSAGNAVADVTEVPAEIVWNYEVGAKGASNDRRLSYSVSLFYQDYSDFQVTLQDDAGNFFTANAGSATNLGVEADVRALLGSSLELFANAAWIDAEIDDDASNGTLAGNRFRLQPEWTASTGLFLDQPLNGALNLTGSLVYSWRSEVFFEPENAPIAGLPIEEDAYGLLSARIGIASAGQGWELSVFASNLLDEEYLVDAGNTGGSFGNPTFVAGPPLFWGVQLDYDFGAY